MQNNTFSTLFVGQNLITLSSVDSTNNYLKQLLSNSEPLPEGTVIMADDQFGGRGQHENRWLAEPGKNVTLSILLRPSFLKVESQFLLNMAISVALNNSISKFLPVELSIKWPNDIYCQAKKIGGVLIENTIVGNNMKTAVVGIGINVNQIKFSEELAVKASSIAAINGNELDLSTLVAAILSAIEAAYLQLRAGNYGFLRKNYADRLYGYNTLTKFKAKGVIFDGTIAGVEDSGTLLVSVNGKINKFNFKEIEFLTS